jgi:hypothetical protein
VPCQGKRTDGPCASRRAVQATRTLPCTSHHRCKVAGHASRSHARVGHPLSRHIPCPLPHSQIGPSRRCPVCSIDAKATPPLSSLSRSSPTSSRCIYNSSTLHRRSPCNSFSSSSRHSGGIGATTGVPLLHRRRSFCPYHLHELVEGKSKPHPSRSTDQLRPAITTGEVPMAAGVTLQGSILF